MIIIKLGKPRASPFQWNEVDLLTSVFESSERHSTASSILGFPLILEQCLMIITVHLSKLLKPRGASNRISVAESILIGQISFFFPSLDEVNQRELLYVWLTFQS